MNNLLDKVKVIAAITKAKNNIYLGMSPQPMHYGDDVIQSLNDGLKMMVHVEATKLIQLGFESFATNLIIELEDCEPDKYPCALCHEEESR